MSLPEPDETVIDPVGRLLEYLDFFRAEVRRKALSMPANRLDSAAAPSGWTVPGLVEHLVHMERRWFVWSFLGEAVDSPQGDRDDEGRWISRRSLDDALGALQEGGDRTRQILMTHDPLQTASTGGKYAEGDTLPTLLAIAFHVLQEYSRHLGHLDIVVELAGGVTGED